MGYPARERHFGQGFLARTRDLPLRRGGRTRHLITINLQPAAVGQAGMIQFAAGKAALVGAFGLPLTADVVFEDPGAAQALEVRGGFAAHDVENTAMLSADQHGQSSPGRKRRTAHCGHWQVSRWPFLARGPIGSPDSRTPIASPIQRGLFWLLSFNSSSLARR